MFLINLIVGSNSFCQLDTNLNYCLSSNNELKTEVFVKSIKQITIQDGDTLFEKNVNVKNGLYQSLIYEGKSEYKFVFDEKGDKLLHSKGFFNDDNKKVQDDCFCNYDSFGRLKSYIIHQKNEGEEIKQYKDNVYYLNGEDSIKYIGSFYSMIIYRNKIGDKSFIRTVADTLGNIQLIEKFINGRKTFSRSYNEGMERLGIYYFYDNVGKLIAEIQEDWYNFEFMTIVDFTRYLYDNQDRLMKIQRFDEESKLYFIKTIFYNERGLKEKEIEEYVDSGNKRIDLYDYEYYR